ncbi:MAG TPA: hypothetical protein VGK27_10315 [Candidatus Deferrimicrobiaceae bacterium]|jgi:hypothetical protein
MRHKTLKAGVLALCMLGAQGAALAESPLFLPKSEAGPALMSGSEVDALKKEGEALKRKAELLKTAAGKKYAASSDLRKKAGGFRSDATAKGDLLRNQAAQSAEISGLLGDMFGLMSGMGGGGLSSNGALTQALTGKMIQGMQSVDAKGVADAHGQAGQISMDAEKKAGPLEMRADELENEGNRLMEAHNRLAAIANAKFLLVASEEILKKLDGDSRRLDRLKESSRDLAAAMASR